jgi:glycosyltransferase involved in cell wall biosynthesis
MRIVIFKERLDPYSGFSRHILEVSRRLAARYGIRFTVITSEVRRSTATEWPEGVDVYAVGGRPLTYTRSRYAVIRELFREIRPDVMDVHGGPGAFLTARAYGLPTVFSMHAGWFSLREYRYVRPGDWRDEPKLTSATTSLNVLLPRRGLMWALRARRPAAVAVPTRPLERALKRGLRCPVYYIPSGVDPEALQPVPTERAKETLRLSPEDQVVLFFGKAQLLRGVDTLLMAFEHVVDALPQAHLLLLLRPDASDAKIQKLVERHPRQARITLTLATLDPKPYLAAADVVALPFRTALALPAQPLTLLEALALGKPVITTRLAVTEEILTHGREGLLVPPNRADLLADQILWALRHPEEAARLGARARSKVLHEYNWDEIAERTLEFYRVAHREEEAEGDRRRV